MPPLPLELIEEIIDIVAECGPESLTNCALVSRRWTPRSTHHIDRIFRTPMVSTFDALHAFFALVQRHPRLAALATSLEVVPVPELNSASASYVPFHHLASHILPNVRRLILEETLCWSDYPLLYRTGTVGFSFCSVVALDISCHFSSIWDLFSVIHSFRNIQDVRLIYPHHSPPVWMFPKQTHNILPHRRPFSRETFKLQNLELPLAIVTPVLEAFGESVVNISVVCPEMSTVSSRDVSEDFTSSWALLQTVKITVPVDKDDSMLYPGLGKLRYLFLAPITKPDVRYSLFLIICQEHNARGYYLEGISVTRLQQIILTGKGVDQFEDCPHCKKNLEPSPRTSPNFVPITSLPTIEDQRARFLSTRSLTYSRSTLASRFRPATYLSLPTSSAPTIVMTSTSLPQHTDSTGTSTTLRMHPLFVRTRLRRAPVTYNVSFTPSVRTVLDRATHAAIPSHMLSQPATDPPTPAGARLVLRSHKFPWPVIVTASDPSSRTSSRARFTISRPSSHGRGSRPGTADGGASISNLDVLYAVHTTLMVPITHEEWDALGDGSKAQRRVARACERRCTRMGGGWEGGVRRVDWLGEKTWLIGVEVDKAAGHGGAGKLIFGRG